MLCYVVLCCAFHMDAYRTRRVSVYIVYIAFKNKDRHTHRRSGACALKQCKLKQPSFDYFGFSLLNYLFNVIMCIEYRRQL